MENYRVMTKAQLRQANEWAIKIGYNRAFKPEPLQKFLDEADDDIRFPIIFSMPHEHAGGEPVPQHMRCKVILDGEGASGLIDIDADLYNALDRIDNSKEG